MARKLQAGDKLIIATHNPGKLREIAALLTPYGINVVSAGELGLPEPVEDGDSFTANALIKARSAAEGAGHPALADDSGLCVDALGGAPGIHSARWAGPEKDFQVAMERVSEALEASVRDIQDGGDDRSAHFICVLAVAWPDGHAETFEGRVYGTLVWPPRGDKGFGYDPMFEADGRAVTFGEMDPDEKHRISHRANAFQHLLTACLPETQG